MQQLLCVGFTGWLLTASVAIAAEPREYTSRNFLLRTDLPADEAKDLIARLETMLVQVGRYWGKPNAQTIEMYVVQDLGNWPPGYFPDPAFASLRSG
ncbi:MAG: hypothetical protein SH850_17780, partial [Planctomycetaceae bacterium]|nr:hypothetical protein [Planctomycetaceae bacterium]